jgi:hypothetical protein
MPGKKKPGPSVKDPEVYEEIRERRGRSEGTTAESTGRPESLRAGPWGGGWPGPEPCYHQMITEGSVASRRSRCRS